MTQMLYKCPGNPKRPDHIKIKDDVIDYIVVDDVDVEGALADGWAASPEEAINGTKKKAPAKRKPAARKRARTEEGLFQADDPATPDVNEAFEE